MRADRLLSLILLLKRTDRPVSARALAEELEVSVRTIMRDVEALSLAGVPVYCERGSRGGIGLLPGFRTDVTGLTDGELGALFLGLGAADAKQLGIQAPLTSALRKLTAALPEQRRDAAVRLGSRILVDPTGWLPGVRVPWLSEARQAVTARATVDIHYQSGTTGRTERISTPAMGLLCAANTWYLVGAQGTQGKFYRLDRIDDLATSAHALPVPESFDLESCWQAARARFRERFSPVLATLSVTTHALARLRGWCSITAVRPDSRAGWSLATVQFGDLSHATEVLPRIAAGLRVVGPAELRKALRAHAREVLRAVKRPPAKCSEP